MNIPLPPTPNITGQLHVDTGSETEGGVVVARVSRQVQVLVFDQGNPFVMVVLRTRWVGFRKQAG